MSPDTPDDTPPPAPPAAPAPALQEFTDTFTAPVAKEWAADSATILNDYFQRRDIADASAQAGQAFVNNLDQFKTGLTNFVESDPHAVHTALDLVPPTVGALIATLPGGIENPDDHHAAVTGHIQHEIAAAAVTAAAEGHEGLARGMLADERISGILGDSVGPLDTYIGMQANARERDAAAQRGQQEVRIQKVADNTARGYIGDLVGPDNNPRSPPGWNQAIISDPKVPPQDKVALMGIHDRLGTNGDPPTDPIAATDLIHRMATGQAGQRDIYPAIGSHVSMADGGFLTSSLDNPTYLKQLDQTLQAGQRQFAPHGDIAETQAYGRFVDWVLPRARAGANLDPNHPDWVGANGMPDFRVQGDDLHAATMQDVAYRQSLGERRQLSEIFSNPEYRKPTRSNPSGSFGGGGDGGSPDTTPPVPMTYRRVAGGGVELVPAISERNVPGAEAEGQRLMREQAARQRGGGGAVSGPQPGDEILNGGQPMDNPRAAASRVATTRYRPRRR